MLAVAIADIGKVIAAALVAGVGVTTIFSFALLGSVRSTEARMSGRTAAPWILLQVVAGIAFVIAVGLGVYTVAYG